VCERPGPAYLPSTHQQVTALPSSSVAFRCVSTVKARCVISHGVNENTAQILTQPLVFPPPRETRCFDGRHYILEEAIRGHVAFIRAWRVDEAGNVVFRYTANNFSSAMARSAKVTIVEVRFSLLRFINTSPTYDC
jgi:hypothetical protein